MKVKIQDIVAAAPTIQKLSGISLPVKVSYNIARNLKKIQRELEPFEKARIELVRKHGNEDEEGKLVVKEENMQEFYKEMTELLEEEIEIDIRSIDIEGLAKIELSPTEMQLIDFMLAIEEK